MDRARVRLKARNRDREIDTVKGEKTVWEIEIQKLIFKADDWKSRLKGKDKL